MYIEDDEISELIRTKDMGEVFMGADAVFNPYDKRWEIFESGFYLGFYTGPRQKVWGHEHRGSVIMFIGNKRNTLARIKKLNDKKGDTDKWMP